jgi:TonB family protein
MRLFMIVFLLMSINGFSQEGEKKGTIKIKKKQEARDTAVIASFDEIYAFDSDLPGYPGGSIELNKFISSRIKYPQIVKAKKVSGICYTSFIVNADGKISNIIIANGVNNCPECDKEAIRILKLMGPWEPGKINGQIAPVQYNLPIEFNRKQSSP